MPHRGLGRGLGALLPTGDEGDAGPGARYAEIAVDAVTPNPRQPRRNFDEESLAELTESIRQVGLLQPVVVRETGPGAYQLVMGERRWRASRLAGLVTLPAIVRETPDTELLRQALLENLQREALNPLEEAAAYRQLLSEFDVTHDDLAEKLGVSRSQVTNTVRLLNLSPAVQRRVAAGVLAAGHARALLGVADPAAQERLADRVVAEGLSVRAVEEIVAVGLPDEHRRRRSRRPAPTSELPAVGQLLADHFETKVSVHLGRRKGRLVLEFANLDDLSRIAATMSVPPAVQERLRSLAGPERQPGRGAGREAGQAD
jgi:ParB family chromosome partitioning protein